MAFKSTITIDNAGRIMIPKYIRQAVGIEKASQVCIEQKGREVVISPAKDICVICGSTKTAHQIGDKWLCDKCISEVKELTN